MRPRFTTMEVKNLICHLWKVLPFRSARISPSSPKPLNLSQCLQCLPYQSPPHPSTGPLSCTRWQVYKMARKLEFLVQWHLTVPFSPTEITSVRQSALFTASIYLKSCSNTWQCRKTSSMFFLLASSTSSKEISRKVAIWAATGMNVFPSVAEHDLRGCHLGWWSSVQVQNYYSFDWPLFEVLPCSCSTLKCLSP